MHVLRSRRDVLENRLVHGRTYSTEYRGVGARGVVFSAVFCLSAVPLRTVLRRLGERHCSHQIMSKRVPQRHRFDLVKPTHQKLAEPASARNGVDTFGGRGALFVNLLACFTAHALAPLGKRFAVIGQRHIRITAGVSRVAHRSVDGGTASVGIFDVSVAGKATVGEPLGWTLSIALLDLLKHGEELTPIAAAVAHFDSHNDLALGRARQLHVLGRTKPAVGHLHHPRLSIGARGPRLSALLVLFLGLVLLFAGGFFLFLCFSTSASCSSAWVKRAWRSWAARSRAARRRRSLALGS